MNRTAPDSVFRALADPRRRRLLELLRARPGQHASALAARFPVSRIAVVKHLRVLEQGGLVERRRAGKGVALFVREEPLARALAEGLARCAPGWVARLERIKRTLESPEPAMSTPSSPRHVYVVYIRTGPERLWEAMTKPEMTRQFHFGTDVRSTFRKGASIEYTLEDENGKTLVPVRGEVLEAVPGKRLVHTFAFPHLPDAPTRVTYEIEPSGPGVVRLTVTHEGFAGETPTFNEVGGGWPRSLSSLKSLLETGTALTETQGGHS